MTKKRIVTSMEKISPELRERIYEVYPDGWIHHVIRVNKPTGDFFHAIAVDTEEVAYLIKVPVKVDSKSDLEKMEENGFLSDASHTKDRSSEEENEDTADVTDDDTD